MSIKEKQLSMLLATNEVRTLTLFKWYDYLPDDIVSSYIKNSLLIWGKNTYTECIQKEYVKTSKNIIVSSNKDAQSLLRAMNTKNKLVKVRTDAMKALDYCSMHKEKEIIIMGGAKLYQSVQTLKQVNRLLLVVVKGQEQTLPQLLNFPMGKVIRKEQLSDNVYFVEMIIENYEQIIKG